MHEFHMPHPPQEPEWKQLELAPGMQLFIFILDFGFWILDYFLLFYIFLFAFLAAGMSVGDGGGRNALTHP